MSIDAVNNTDLGLKDPSTKKTETSSRPHGAYAFTLGADVGAALFEGIRESANNANVIQSYMMAALSKLLEVSFAQLSTIKQEEIKAEQGYMDDLNKDNVNEQSLKLNQVKTKYNAAEQSETTLQNQLTQGQQSLQQQAANLIQNLLSMVDIYRGVMS